MTATDHTETSGDRVTTEASLRYSEVASQAAAASASVRTSQLATVTAQVKLGTYRPNPQVIAEQILDDAELQANPGCLQLVAAAPRGTGKPGQD